MEDWGSARQKATRVLWKKRKTKKKKDRYTENYCKTCDDCAKKKVLHEIKAPLYPITAHTPFEKVGLYIIGPLPTTDTGNTHILVFIDYLTKRTESIPLSQTDAPLIAKHLYSELICRHGTPEMIMPPIFLLINDRGL